MSIKKQQAEIENRDRIMRIAQEEGIDAADAAADWSCGVESVSCGEHSIQYLNAGDTYAETLIYDANADPAYYWGSWGAWLEATEEELNDENGTIRCGNCGEFTPVLEEWLDTLCQHCKRYVDDGTKPSWEVCENCGVAYADRQEDYHECNQ